MTHYKTARSRRTSVAVGRDTAGIRDSPLVHVCRRYTGVGRVPRSGGVSHCGHFDHVGRARAVVHLCRGSRGLTCGTAPHAIRRIPFTGVGSLLPPIRASEQPLEKRARPLDHGCLRPDPCALPFLIFLPRSLQLLRSLSLMLVVHPARWPQLR